MKNQSGNWTKALVLALMVLASSVASAAVEDFQLSVRNLQQTAQNRLEFDVYLLDTDAGQTFELAGVQLAFLINSQITTGALSVTISNSGSGLNVFQQFSAVPAVVTPLTGYPNQTLIRLAAGFPVTSGSGTIISTSGNGTLLTHFIVTSTTNFVANSQPNLIFTSNTVAAPLYPTRVAVFIATVSTPLTVIPLTNAIVDGNPVLNPPAPVQYDVTGGGSYCSGGAGVEVGLSDSEAGATYTLIRDGLDLTPPVPGTGNAISFGLQTVAGIYTVRGTNAGGSTSMTGSATVTVLPLPVAPVAQNGSGADCSQITANWQASAGTTAYFLDVSTSNTFATFVTSFQNRNVGTVLAYDVTGLTAGTAYYYRVRSQNTCGTSGNSGTITYSTSPAAPSQPGIITGPASPCPGTEGLTYTVDEVTNATAYSWTVPAGWSITLGQNTRTITVTAGTAGGTIRVTASNSCGTSTARTLDVTVGTLSVVPTGISISNNNTCSGTDKILTVTGGSLGTGALWQWFTGSCGGTSAGTGTSITVDPAAGTSTTYYVRASGTCNTTACVSGTVVVSPAVGTPTTPTPSASTICQGTPSTAFTTSATNATGYVWSVTGSGNTVSGTGTTGTVTWSPTFTGTATISVYATGCGTSSTVSTTTIVRPTPTASIAGTASVCQGTAAPNITFTNPQALPVTVTYNIDGSNEANINIGASASANLTVPTTSPGIFDYNIVSVAYQSAPSCPNAISGTATVTVNPTPSVLDQTASITTGGTFTVTPTDTPTGTTYTWTVPSYTGGVTGGVAQATGVASITGTLTVPSGTGTATYTVTPRTGTCVGSAFTLTVTVTSSCVPVVITSDPVDASICSGGSSTFSVTATGTTPAYQWQYNNGGTWINVVNGTPAGAAYSNATTSTLGVSGITGAGSYQYRCNATNCSVSSDQSTVATLTVNANPAQPTITADGPTTFCAGEDVILTSSEASTYLWSTGATTRSITVSAAGNYTVQVTNANSCQSVVSATTVVTVNALPSRPTISPAGSVTICAGSSQTLTASTGVSYLWSNGENTQSISVNTTGSYTVQVTNTFGCLSTASLATSVTVNPTPATPTITPSGLTTFCAGGSVTLTSTVSSEYLWSTGATTRSIIVNSTGTYWVRVTDANGCQSAQSATTAVTVNPLPAAPTVGTITQPTCTVSTGSVVLGGLPAGSWTVNPGNITGSTPTVTVTGLAAGSRTFTVTNSNGCISAASIPVVINTQPAVPTVPVVGTVSQPTCAVSTGSVGFSGLPSTGIWTLTRLPDGDTSTGTGTTATLTGIPSGTYTFTVTNSVGCVSAATAPVTINAPLPVPSAPVQTIDCTGGFSHAVVTVTSPTGAGYQYQLDAGTFQTGTTFNDVANGNHTITVRNASGCTATGTTFSINCGCTTPPLVTLAASSGSTCGVTAVTVSGNTFGGSATSVLISDNGGGTVTPASASASPFFFSYTPTSADAGRTVVITVTTNNPLGSPCAAASATYTLTVNANPAAPVPGTVTQPSCSNPGGSVMLNNLPATGDWTITRTPGGTTTTGSGTSTTITGLTAGTYTFTVTNLLGCVSPASANVVINTQPDTPSAPVIGTITQPTCALSTGSVAISGLPATGTWTLTRSPGGVAVSGTGTTRTVAGVTSGTYTFTVANAAGCISPASEQVIINPQPETPSAPIIGTITHPTCELATGSILLENMPAIGEWTLTRYPGGITSTGTGTSATISTLGAGTYNFAVTNASGCNSPVSANAVINAQPPTPTAPVVGIITHPTFTVATGSVVLSGLPSSGTWTLTRNPDGFTSQGTGTTRTVSGLEPGTYTFTVTNSAGCTSALTGNIVINARPGAPIVVINNPPNICSDQTTDLTQPAVTAGSDANLTFTYWTDAAATVPYATPSTASAGTYYIMGTSTAGYYTVKPVVVTADELPVANAGIDQILDYTFGTTLIADIPEIGTGIWELISGTGDLFNSTSPSTLVSGLSIGDNVFSWTVTNGACNPVSDLILIKVNNLIIPTLITPNQDGANDFFVLRGLETLGRTELTIFDRRGLKVYENRDYDNLWDGVDYNSNPLPDDTYFWVVRADNGVSLSGYIVVRR